MTKYITVFFIVFMPFFMISQNNEIIYALNSGVTTKQVSQGVKVVFKQTKPFPNSSYVKIKKKNNNLFYVQTTINSQFVYGHYFKYDKRINGEYRYIRTDGDEIEYILTNYPLNELALSNKYDEKINLKLINYRTSFAMLLKF
tara:strand:+ start:673 stop:1101 length:429 start_codon:yes stop_codon:yes gene_type:complete